MIDPDMTSGRRWTGFGSVFGALDWNQVREEVERECRGRVALVGLPGVGKSTLFNRLRGWEVSPVSGRTSGANQEDLGVFRLVDLPGGGPTSGGWSGDGYGEVGWVSLAEATLVVFVLDVSAGVRPTEYSWLSRVRAAGRPMVTVLNKVDVVGDGLELEEVQREVERRLATPVIAISAQSGVGVSDQLVPRMLRTCPDVAVPLGRELGWVRRPAAGVLIRQAALWSALTGAEPVPLLDVPIQFAAQQRLLMRIAAMYGQPPGDGRELLATLAGGLGMRLVAQQVAKLVPVLGWGASAALSGLSTWLLGWGAVAYYEGQVTALETTAQAWARATGGGLGELVRRVPLRRTQGRLWPVRRRQGAEDGQAGDVEAMAEADSAEP